MSVHPNPTIEMNRKLRWISHHQQGRYSQCSIVRAHPQYLIPSQNTHVMLVGGRPLILALNESHLPRAELLILDVGALDNAIGIVSALDVVQSNSFLIHLRATTVMSKERKRSRTNFAQATEGRLILAKDTQTQGCTSLVYARAMPPRELHGCISTGELQTG